MIIDFHTYVGHSMLGQHSTEEELLENMEKNNIGVSVVCPVKTVDPYFEKQNCYIADLQKKHAGMQDSGIRMNYHRQAERMITS